VAAPGKLARIVAGRDLARGRRICRFSGPFIACNYAPAKILNRPRWLTSPAMKYRKLRIAWSVGCGIICLLLIALWVRSYWWVDGFSAPLTSKYYFGAASSPGCIGFAFHPVWKSSDRDWHFDSVPTERWLENVRHDRLPNISRVWGTFDFQRYSYIAPDWFVLIVLATLAAVPWLRWRFGLRSLLIGMTLVAVLLGVVIWAIR
jgi:hypothetical protein